MTLPSRLLEIVNRFGRDTDPGIHRLRERLQVWCNGTDQIEFERRWTELVEQALTRPHWIAALFPQACAEFPNLLPLIRSLDNARDLPDQRARGASENLNTWVIEQGDVSLSDGLMGRLLDDLQYGHPHEGPAFLFLSRYYAYLDLLQAYLVADALRPLHERIFAILHLQRNQWPQSYCNGYLYQGWEALGLAGIKPTDARLGAYDITPLLSPSDRVLDVGANSGFLALAVGRHVAHVDAVELNPFLVEIGRSAADFLGQKNVRFTIADIESWRPDTIYDAVFSLANHCTIDGRMSMDFENYVARLFSLIKPGGWLFFESHNVFGPGTGAPGDDGDLDAKFDIIERYFECVDSTMHRSFVPAHDIDKLFVKLRRRPTYLADAVRTFSLAKAITRYRSLPGRP